jgi:hypothetical protein
MPVEPEAEIKPYKVTHYGQGEGSDRQDLGGTD